MKRKKRLRPNLNPNKPKRRKYKSVFNSCVSLFSKYIRRKTILEWGPDCPFCLKRPIDCAFHFIGRGKKPTTFDERNVIAACSTCNADEHYSNEKERGKEWYVDWFKAHFGEELWEELKAQSRRTDTWTMEALEDLERDLKLELDDKFGFVTI